ncbi:hypothetical protein QBC35DRAFT_233160 [Podospora australis]|uniref:Domain of unknown function at the cortex 1 domain-containing protein n=1 Tax=Podospora australis TaxID=1536484 RepID=A0AAN6WSW1_9PEZI|nr:hypothetical protein QBC35DRAFT_233160 [Podospora australis]
MADKYLIRVTAGPSYDLSSQKEIAVNKPEPTHFETDSMDIDLSVRVNNYAHGLPRDAPATSAYFEAEPHKHNGDQYSITLQFTPKDVQDMSSVNESGQRVDDAGVEIVAETGISAEDLQFGNNFDHPIRDRLPPGFGTAMNIVKWWIDPGLEGDAYADEPYLYGPALSSFNTVRIGKGEFDESKGGMWVEEGADSEAGNKWREERGVPADGKARMKWALRKENKAKWVWEYGQTYSVDFFNPYVDFKDFALRLPGFNLPIMKYWDGQGLRTHQKRSHQLRYVLRNRSTGEVYLVVLFTLHLAEDINEDGSLKPAALKALAKKSGGEGNKGEKLPDIKKPGDEGFDEEKALEEAKKKLGGMKLNGGAGKENDDDVD